MIPTKLLVANRGEIAIRVMRAASELGISTVAIFSEDDSLSLHTRKADDALPLKGIGPAPYLDIEQIISVAKAAGCDAIHPGCGFLSDNPQFARRCAESGIKFVGPRPEILELFGDKMKARALAERCGVPVVPAASTSSRARHIEVQIIGDGANVSHLWERDCSIQLHNQKIVAVAPSPGLDDAMRACLTDAALRLAKELRYDGLGTFEFLLTDVGKNETGFVFIDAKPGLQAEHTVTEEILGIDLVKTQLKLAGGSLLQEIGLSQIEIPKPRGFAIQLRINMGSMRGDSPAKASGGTLTAFEVPSGPGVRVDTSAYSGYTTSPLFDPLLAKLVAHSPSTDYAELIARAYRALCEFRIEGVATNRGFLQNLLTHRDFASNLPDTRFIEDHLAELTAQRAGAHRELFLSRTSAMSPVSERRLAGTKLRSTDPLAVLDHGKSAFAIEEHPLAFEEGVVESATAADSAEMDLDFIRPDLAEVHERHEIGFDAARPVAVARRRKTHQRTARENIADLCDPGTFVEYGPVVVAAQRRRRTIEDLIKNTPADGLVTGLATVNGDLFGSDKARCVVMAYDYTVLAGTQGHQNHRKKDRMFQIARELRLPLILFAEGGGGRPGDTDGAFSSRTFNDFPKLSGLVPLVGITSGRCYAGNASLLGCCDVVIADMSSNIGMGGPAMIEGGGLGIFRPEEIGAMDVQVPNGVVDIPVADEAAAVRVAKTYLSYFQGSIDRWDCADQRLLRAIVPENRLRIYDIRSVIETMADSGSVLELREHFGLTMVTSLIRIEGHPFGLVANNPKHLAGAIDSDGSDKAAHFIRLCDAFDIPLIFLCDTPGIMVGPAIEKTALVRHSSRMFLSAANATVPFFTIVLRKAYGLGGIAMAAGSWEAPIFTVAWPTGEFGPMGLEGAVKLGYRNELSAIADPAERKKRFDEMVASMYERGKALNQASHFVLDDVIDPAETRRWIMSGLRAMPPLAPRTGKKHQYIDSW